MKKLWEVQSLSLPGIIKYCKKCGKKTQFICSGQFRVNAQRKCLDIWLIYKCSKCNVTWNAPIYSRISPQSLNQKQWNGFYGNDSKLAEQYAMNGEFLRQKGVEVLMPEYTIAGDVFSIHETVELEIKCHFNSPVRVSSLVRAKLQLSQKEYVQLIEDGRLESIPQQDLQKCRLKEGIILIFNRKRPESASQCYIQL